jgi:hypothetical protein
MKAIAVAAILIMLAGPIFAADSCEAQIPSSLKVALSKAFPKFRAPLATDNLAEDIEWDLKEGRKGCLGVAVADFDGDGTKDLLLGLTALRGSGALIVVALARGKNWKLETLNEWPEGRSRLYVAADKPGVYRRTEALDGPLEPGEVNPLTCRHWVAIFGATESSGVAYCYNNHRWQHVWISD